MNKVTRIAIRPTRGKEFILSGLIWSAIFLLIPILIWLGTKNWIVALSTCTKIGVVLVILGLVILSFGTTYISGSTADGAEFFSSGEQMRRPKAVKKHLIKQELNPVLSGHLWITLWGLFYLLPLAFDIPFII